jgi:hypothetical protein
MLLSTGEGMDGAKSRSPVINDRSLLVFTSLTLLFRPDVVRNVRKKQIIWRYFKNFAATF